jgi:hypothetical protein
MKMCHLLKEISISMQWGGGEEMTYTINQSHEIHQMKKTSLNSQRKTQQDATLYQNFFYYSIFI